MNIFLLVARRVTLVVASSYLLQNFGRWQGPTNVILLLSDCRLSGGDNQRWGNLKPTCCNQKIELFALNRGRDARTFRLHPHTLYTTATGQLGSPSSEKRIKSASFETYLQFSPTYL